MAVSTMLLGAACFFLSTTGAMGQDACSDKQGECAQLFNSVSAELPSLVQTRPPNVSAFLAQCNVVKSKMAECVNGIEQVCTSSAEVSNMVQTLKNNVNSLCGQETECSFRTQECGMNMATVAEISQAMGTIPPDVELVQQKCSAMKAKADPCLASLEADCSGVSNIDLTIDSLRSSLDSLCGKNALCQMQMSKCQAPFAQLGSSSSDSSDVQKICKVYSQVKACLDTDLDAECRTLPHIKQVLEGAYNSLSAISCDGQGGSGTEGGASTTCPQASACFRHLARASGLAGNCSGSDKAIQCLEGLKGTCTLDESRVTFEELKPLYVDTCKAVSGSSDCEALSSCIVNSSLVKQFTSVGGQAPTRQQLERMNQLLLSSKTWCQYLTTVTQCHLENAASCRLEGSRTKSVKQLHDKLKETCEDPNSGTSGSPMVGYFLLLVPAVVAVWTSKMTS